MDRRSYLASVAGLLSGCTAIGGGENNSGEDFDVAQSGLGSDRSSHSGLEMDEDYSSREDMVLPGYVDSEFGFTDDLFSGVYSENDSMAVSYNEGDVNLLLEFDDVEDYVLIGDQALIATKDGVHSFDFDSRKGQMYDFTGDNLFVNRDGATCLAGHDHVYLFESWDNLDRFARVDYSDELLPEGTLMDEDNLYVFTDSFELDIFPIPEDLDEINPDERTTLNVSNGAVSNFSAAKDGDSIFVLADDEIARIELEDREPTVAGLDQKTDGQRPVVGDDYIAVTEGDQIEVFDHDLENERLLTFEAQIDNVIGGLNSMFVRTENTGLNIGLDGEKEILGQEILYEDGENQAMKTGKGIEWRTTEQDGGLF